MPPRVAKKWIRGPVDELAIEQGCWFDAAAGQHVIDFMQGFCCLSKGRQWAGKPMKLLPWQIDFVMRLYGWKLPNGLRRYRRFYLEVPKKNGKSALLSALALYALIMDGEPGAEVYVAACDRDQASIVFNESVNMVKASRHLESRLELVPSRKTILHDASKSYFKALSSEVSNKDGFNSHMTIFDELHRQPHDELWKVMLWAGASREQPILGAITTAGDSMHGVWHQERSYAERVNAGAEPDISFLGVVYRAMEGDNPEDPKVWAKANPSLGATITLESFKADMLAAKARPTQWAEWLRLRLNILTQRTGKFIDPNVWMKLADPVDPAELAGMRCWGGLDLSSTRDLTSFALIFEDGSILTLAWCPEDTIIQRAKEDRAPYQAWIQQGLLIPTDGDSVDYDQVIKDIVAFVAPFNLQRVYSDKWNAKHVAETLRDDHGIPVEWLIQGFLSLNDPTKELERLALAGQLKHGGNPALAWCIDNASVAKDSEGRIRLDKRKSREKIDLAAALVNAIGAKLGGAGEETNVYERRGMLFL